MFKKIISISFVITFLLMIATSAFAATKEDVINTLNKTYQVGENETFTIPDRIRVKMVNFIQKKEDLTPSQCDQLIYFANKAYEIAQTAGTTDITQMDPEDVKAGIGLLVEASNTVEIDLEKELAEANITLPNVNDIDKGKDKIDTNENQIANEKVPNEESGESFSEEIALSSDVETKPIISGGNKGDEITPKINRIISITFVLVFVVFLVSVLLLRLVIKSKWSKVLKTIVATLLFVLLIASVVSFIILIVFSKTIRLTLRLYYMFL